MVVGQWGTIGSSSYKNVRDLARVNLPCISARIKVWDAVL